MIFYAACSYLLSCFLLLRLASVFILQYYHPKRFFLFLAEHIRSFSWWRLFQCFFFLFAHLSYFFFPYLVPYLSFALMTSFLFLDRLHKMKWTKRSIRLVIASGLGLSFFFLLDATTLLFLSLYLWLWLPFFLIIIWAFLYPLEQGIRYHYIKQAKRKLAKNPSLTILAITGSYGKTSFKYYAKQILSFHYVVQATEHSINTLMGLTRYINQKLEETTEILILECGVDERGGMDKILRLFHPHIAVLTAVGQMHLATFKTLENILQEKKKLLEAVKNPSLAFYAGESTWLQKACHSFGFTCYQKEDYFSQITRTKDGSEAIFQIGEKKKKIKIPLFGIFQFTHLSGIVHIALHFGFTFDELAFLLLSLRGEEHRLEKRVMENMVWLDDAYNGNEEGIKEGIQCIKMMEGRKAIITPGVIELAQASYEVNYRLGKEMVGLDAVYIVGEDKHPAKFGYLENGGNPKCMRVVKNFLEGYQYAKKENIQALYVANDTFRSFLK